MGLCSSGPSRESAAKEPRPRPATATITTTTTTNGSLSPSSSDVFPKLGVPLSEFRLFVDKCGGAGALGGLSTTDVNERFLKPLTLQSQASYCELRLSQGSALVQEAQVFISHAWKFTFLEVVEALEHHFRAQPHIVIWFDLFSNNQHRASSNDFNWWCTTFKSAIGQFKHTVLVLSPWANPVPFTRAWCLFEILCSIVTDARFEIAMSSVERKAFMNSVLYDNSAVSSMLGAIDVQRSEAFIPSDKQAIFQAVDSLIGMQTVNKILLDMLRRWTIEVCTAFIAEEEEELQRVSYTSALACVYEGNGDFAKAEELYVFCLQRRLELLGPKNAHTTVSMNNLAVLYSAQHRYAEAAPLFEKCIALSREMNVDDGMSEILSLNNLATCYDNLGEYAKAEPLYRQCFDTMRARFGDADPYTLVFMNNLAYLYSNTARFDDAEQLYEECIRVRTQILGENHPDTLIAQLNLARTRYMKGDLRVARDMWTTLLVKYRVRFGEGHPATADLVYNLQQVNAALGESSE